MLNQKKESAPLQDQAAASKPSSILENTIKLLVGSGSAQILRVLLSPIIARLFPPAALGIAQNYSAIGKTGAVLATLRYEDSIQLPEHGSRARQQLLIAVLSTIFNTAISFILLLLFHEPIARFLNAPQLSKLLLTLPLFILARGVFLSLRSWYIRKEAYARVSAAGFAENAIWDSASAALGFAGQNGSPALIISQIAGQVFAASSLAFSYIKNYKILAIDWSAVREGMREYRKFPLYNTWSKLLDNAALYLPALLLSAFYSPAVAGQFTLSFNLLQLPFSMVANTIGQVLYQQAPNALRSQSLKDLVLSILKPGLKLVIVPVWVVAIVGREIVTFIFGPNWVQAGTFTQILAPWMLCLFLSLMLERLPAALGKNENILVFHALNVFSRIGALWVGAQLEDPAASVWLLSICGCVLYGGNILSILRLAGIPFRNTVGTIVKALLPSLAFYLPLLIGKRIFGTASTSSKIIMLASAAILSVIYGIFILQKDIHIRNLLQHIMRKK